MKRIQPDVVVLVVYLGNDLIDNLGPYPLSIDFAKPFFELKNDDLVIRNTPVPRQSKSVALFSRSFSSAVLQGVTPKQSLLARSEILRRLGCRDIAYNISGLLAENTKASIDLFDALIWCLDESVQAVNANLVVALLTDIYTAAVRIFSVVSGLYPPSSQPTPVSEKNCGV